MTAYETITARIIAQLESGVIPWRKPWTATARGTQFPHNFSTGKSYRGANILSLMCSSYQSSAWMTYKQAQEMGAQVRKGEKASPVVFWKFFKKGGGAAEGEAMPEPAEGGGAAQRGGAMSRLYWVFNVEQIDGITAPLPFEVPAFDPIDSADRIVSAFLTCGNAPTLAHGGDSAHYSPLVDKVQMPYPGTFKTPAHYYSTLFHEFGHSTGIESRCARTFGKRFGDETYAHEELCAEFTAAFCSAEAGIGGDDLLLGDSAAYIDHWLGHLRKDPTMAVYAAQRAQKAADYILRKSATSEEVAA
jgi:antirestriction protein ArdC